MKRGNDVVGSASGVLFWCLPIAAILAGSAWQTARLWLWIPAFLVMGLACVANARECGRTHCFVTGPLFLLAAAYLALAASSLVPIHYGIFSVSVVTLTALAFLAEFPLGKYRR